jgi:ribose transport system substrate-binding protein
MVKFRVLLLLVIAALALVVTACGEDDEQAAPASVATEGAGGAERAEVPFSGSIEDGVPIGYDEPERGDLTIGFASALDANETVNYEGRAIKLETERLGGRYILADAAGDPDKQVSDIERLIAQRVDAIIVFPLDANALTPVLSRAEEAGIPVVGIEANVESKEAAEGYDTQVWQRRDFMSYLQAKEAARIMPPGAKFGQVGFAVPVPTIEKQVERARHWAEQFGLASLGRVDNQTDDIAGGEKAMTELFGQYPDMQGLIAYNEESATGAQAAARQQGKRDMPLIGNNGGSLGFESVRSGRISATVQIQVPDVGRFTTWAAYLLAQGKEVPPVVMTGEPKVVNPETVESVQTWEQSLQERYGKTK